MSVIAINCTPGGNTASDLIWQDFLGSNVIADKRIDFDYDAFNPFTKASRYADQSATEFVGNTFYSYDGLGRLSKMGEDKGGG